MSAAELEHAELCEELRCVMRTARLGRDVNGRVVQGFVWRGCGEAMPIHAMPLVDLRGSILHLRAEVEKHGAVAALCELTWWSDGGEMIP